MSDSIKVIVALDEGVDRYLIEAALPQDATLDIVGTVEGLEEGWQTFLETPSDLVIIGCNGYSDRVVYLIDGSVRQKPDRPVVVLTQASPNGLLRRAFEAGADDVMALPETPENVRFVLQKALARRKGAAIASGVSVAPLVCILGPKGGTGKTLVAANLAVALARKGERVSVVDLDLQFGDMGLALGLAPERTIYDLAKAGGYLDADKMDGFLMRHSSGVKVLVAPARPDHASAVSIEFLRDVYSVLRGMSDIVIVDTPPGFTPEVIATIDISTSVLMVGMLDSLSLKNTKLGLETLELMGYPPEHTSLVLNRADTRVGITRDDVMAIVGRAPNVMVPSDREIPRSVNEGVPIVASRERSDAARAFRELAQAYEKPAGDGEQADAARLGTRRRGMLRMRRR
jgi:pilus assembly protein CpaE